MPAYWIELNEIPGYVINELGEIKNTKTNRLKEPSCNQQGILMVNLAYHSRQYVRSVAVLVAERFVDRRGWPPHFDTPIHLNGNRRDCRAANLTWRPRWFAIAYHKQFRKDTFGESAFKASIKNIDTGEVFISSWDAAMQYGMLENELVLAILNFRPAGFQQYRLELV